MFGLGWTVPLEKRVAELETIIQDSGGYSSMDTDGWIEWNGFQGATISGPRVSSDTSMRIAAVFACVRLLGSCLASSPADVYMRKPNALSRKDRELAPDHPLSRMLRVQPNETLGAKIYWKRMMQDKIVAGNAYSWIERRGKNPVALWWLHPRQVSVYQAWELGIDKKLGMSPYRLFYAVTFSNNEYMVIDQDDMFHVPNLGWDGKNGQSTISAAAETMGLALAREEHSARFFSQGTKFNIGVEFDGMMKDDVRDRFQSYLERHHQGVSNQHKPLIVTDGGKIKELSMSARDAQLLESMQASYADICSLFGVPVVMVRETDKQSSWGTGIEQIILGFTKFTMNDHFTDFELEMERKLFRDDKYFAEFDETELTRGDTNTLYAAMRIARGNSQEPGFLSINEIRAKLGERPDTEPESNELYRPQQAVAPTQPGDANDQEPTAPTE